MASKQGGAQKIYSYMNYDSGSISNIDDAIINIPTGAHAAEARGGTFRRALEAVYPITTHYGCNGTCIRTEPFRYWSFGTHVYHS